MPAVTRELAIVYGSLTLGGSSSTYLLTGTYTVRHGYAQVTIECSVVVVADTQAAFRTAYIALEDGMRKPRQALTVTLGGGSQEFKESDNSGFNASAAVARSPAGSTFDTGMSRLYDVTITVDLPADLTGDNGLATKAIDVVTDAAGRATVTINGSYTALGANSATDQYAAQSPALVTATMSALGISQYEEIQSDVAEDFTDKMVSFRITLLQIIYPETASATNDARLKNVRLSISRGETGPGDADGNVDRPVELTVAYGCDVVKSLSQDLDGLFDNVILPYMVAKAKEVTSASAVAVVQKSPMFDRSGNGIEATISIMAYSAGAIISHQMTMVDDENYGIRLIPVWDGNPNAKIIQDAEGIIVKTVREETVRFRRKVGGGSGSTFTGNPGYVGGVGGIGNLFGNLSSVFFGGGSLSIDMVAPQSGPSKKSSGQKAKEPEEVSPADRSNGMFVPVRFMTETTPMVQGIEPYQVSLERVLSVTTAVFVAEPERGFNPEAPEGSAGSGGGGSKNFNNLGNTP